MLVGRDCRQGRRDWRRDATADEGRAAHNMVSVGARQSLSLALFWIVLSVSVGRVHVNKHYHQKDVYIVYSAVNHQIPCSLAVGAVAVAVLMPMSAVQLPCWKRGSLGHVNMVFTSSQVPIGVHILELYSFHVNSCFVLPLVSTVTLLFLALVKTIRMCLQCLSVCS